MNPIAFLADIMLQVLDAFYKISGNYGIAIILLTVVVKIALYPLTLQSTKQMKKMQTIQPKVKELQAKHKGEPEKIQKETMQLYKSSGVNPLGGCLPMVLQMPVFIALFFALTSAQFNAQLVVPNGPVAKDKVVKIFGQTDRSWEKYFENPQDDKLVFKQRVEKDSFKQFKDKKEEIWDELIARNYIDKKGNIKDEYRKHYDPAAFPLDSKYDPIKKDIYKVLQQAGNIEEAIRTSNIDAEKKKEFIKIYPHAGRSFLWIDNLARPDKTFVLVILIALSTFWMQKGMTQDPTQKQLMYFMPAFIAFISIGFPAGVQLYWVVSNLIQMLQQQYVMKQMA